MSCAPFIQRLFTSRDNNACASTFVGQEGRLWWDPLTNSFYYSDGSTPGGIPVGGGGGGVPGGANTQIQFNNGGAFGGNAGLTYCVANSALTLQGDATGNATFTVGSSTTPGIISAYGPLTTAKTITGTVNLPVNVNAALLGPTTVTGIINVPCSSTLTVLP